MKEFTEYLEAAKSKFWIPTNIETWVKKTATPEQRESFKQVVKWLKADKYDSIVGGTTIGKSPQTLILDLTYQGNEIYINRDGEIEVCNIENIKTEEKFLNALRGPDVKYFVSSKNLLNLRKLN